MKCPAGNTICFHLFFIVAFITLHFTVILAAAFGFFLVVCLPYMKQISMKCKALSTCASTSCLLNMITFKCVTSG